METVEAYFLNYELSWLEFNRRVLHEAMDHRTPLIERLKFLNIFGSNLDEFFMKRVGGLKRQVLANISSSGLKELTPEDQLSQIRLAVEPLIEQQALCFTTLLQPALEAEGIRLLKWEDLTDEELEFLNGFFSKSVFPVLTPLAVDPGHPFPFISNLSVSLGVLMRHPDRESEDQFARVKIPDIFPTWIRVNPRNDDGEFRFVSLYELIGRNLGSLFPGIEILDVMVFRVTRNAEADKEEEDAEDLLEMVAEELRERRFAQVVRLEHGPNPNSKILNVLTEELQLSNQDVYEIPIWLEYFALQPLFEINRRELKYPTAVPVIPSLLSDPDANIFEIIRATDILVHHPYESFTASVERFIRSASEDPSVIAIKMTLYRTGEDSPFIPLLIHAAESGKQVACLVELKARFDEQKNIQVAQALEKAGVHVVYGIMGLKTHCKIALVVRQEEDSVRCYAHFGTGNYHARTARLYTDLGLFTAKRAFTADAVHLFHYLTGRALHWKFKKLLVAPMNMKESFLQLIERECEIQEKGGEGHIIGKMNSLEDQTIIEALYRASQRGVRIDLIVRGVCCLKPQVPGLSENIRVISVIGRFLEHSRIFYFRNGAQESKKGAFYIGSADWMHRNLNSRVEAIVPVEESELREKCWEILDILLHDERQVWDMKADGTYQHRGSSEIENARGCHEILLKLTRQRATF